MARSTSILDASPVNASAKIGRVDEGVDITQNTPFIAAASGVVSYIDRNFYRGTPSVYVTLDNPITVNGRTYTQMYYAETAALVKVGDRVTAGQTPVIGPGTSEIGFASGNLPAAHATYHEGAVTTAGKDFASVLANVLYRNPQDRTPDTKVTNVNVETGQTTVTKGPKTGGAVGELASWADFFARISDPSYILRGLQLVAGGVLVLVGIYLLAKQVGLAEKTPEPVKDVALTVTGVTAARESRAQSRAYSEGRTQGRRAGARREGRKAGQEEISSREPIATGVTPVYSTRATPRRNTQSDEVPF